MYLIVKSRFSTLALQIVVNTFCFFLNLFNFTKIVIFICGPWIDTKVTLKTCLKLVFLIAHALEINAKKKKIIRETQ